MSDVYTAHLAHDEERRATACGEPWQGWQEPDLAGVRDVAGQPLPPMNEPAHGTPVRQCQACMSVALKGGHSAP